MTALPTVPSISPGVSNADILAYRTDIRAFLAGLLGTDGTVPTALAALGAIIGAGVEIVTETSGISTAWRGKAILATGAITLNLPMAVNAGAGWAVLVDNVGTGTVTLEGAFSETVDGAQNAALPRGRSAFLICTGTAWVTVAMPGNAGGPVLFTPGAAPGLAVGGDEDTGVGSPAADQLGLMAANVYRAILSATALTLTVPLLLPSGSAAAPSLAFATDTNTGLMLAGADILAAVTGGSERARFSPAGLLVGETSVPNGIFGQLRVNATAGGLATAWVNAFADSSSGPSLVLCKTRASSAGGVTIVQAGDVLGQVRFHGADGVDVNNNAADIVSSVIGTPATDDIRGNIRLRTRGAGGLVDRLEVDEVGITLTGRMVLNGVFLDARSLVVANNAVAVFTPPRTGGTLDISCGGQGATPNEGGSATLSFDVGSSPALEKSSAWSARGALVDAAAPNTDLTVTPGASGRLTVSARSNGTIQVNNRLGVSQTIQMLVRP